MTAPLRPSAELAAYAAKEEAAARAILDAAVEKIRRYHPAAAVETLVGIAMHDPRVRAEVNHHRRRAESIAKTYRKRRRMEAAQGLPPAPARL